MDEFDLTRSRNVRRLNKIGHRPGCCCEACWWLIEKAIQEHLPGFLPEDPGDPSVAQLEEINLGQREEIQHLRAELARLAAATGQGPTEKRGLDVDPR
jgi:hypothetical protein